MEAVIIVIHLMVIVALVAVVLLQRSEGGALGIGGSNQFLSSRGQGNVLTRATTILGIGFFLTSIGLTILSRIEPPPSSILNSVTSTVAPIPAPATGIPSSTAGTLIAPAPLVPAPGPAPAVPAAPATTPGPAAPAQ